MTASCGGCGERTDCVWSWETYLCATCLYKRVDGGTLVTIPPDQASASECWNCGDTTERMYCSACAECANEYCEALAEYCDVHNEVTKWCENCGDDEAYLCHGCAVSYCDVCVEEEADVHFCDSHNPDKCPECGDYAGDYICRNCAKELYEIKLPAAVVSDDGSTMTVGETEVRWN